MCINSKVSCANWLCGVRSWRRQLVVSSPATTTHQSVTVCFLLVSFVWSWAFGGWMSLWYNFPRLGFGGVRIQYNNGPCPMPHKGLSMSIRYRRVRGDWGIVYYVLAESVAPGEVSVKAWVQLKAKSRKQNHGEHGIATLISLYPSLMFTFSDLNFFYVLFYIISIYLVSICFFISCELYITEVWTAFLICLILHIFPVSLIIDLINFLTLCITIYDFKNKAKNYLLINLKSCAFTNDSYLKITCCIKAISCAD